MKKLKDLLLFSSLLLISTAFISTQGIKENSRLKALQQADTSQWIAPDSVNELVNPIEVDEESLAIGKMVYRKECRSCHGRLGDGKGSGAGDISTVPTNFTNPDFLKQSDGSLFWKISKGRNDMDPYEKKLTEEDLWIVVNYIKTFVPSE